MVEEGFKTERVGDSVVFCATNFSRELSQTIKSFVRQPRTADYRQRVFAARLDDGAQLLGREPNRFIPRRGNQLAALLVPDKRRANSLLVIDEWMSEAALDAEELTIQSVDVTVARDYTHQLATARPERHLAAIRAISTSRNSLRQFPWPRLMTISSVKQGPCRADLDTVTAL